MLQYVIHQGRQQIGDSKDSRSIRSVRCRCRYFLVALLCKLKVSARDGVYDVEGPKFMRSRTFFEVSVQFLDDNRLRLFQLVSRVSCASSTVPAPRDE